MRKTPLFRLISITVLTAFTSLLPAMPSMAQVSFLPQVGSMVAMTPAFQPMVVKGIKLYTDNPFKFDFIVDTGDMELNQQQIKDQGRKLASYFLASLTTPEKQMWVNLSPYEHSRIIPKVFGDTQMGMTLLAEDYMLKQIMATALYPERQLGREFWQKVYAQAEQQFGTTQVPVNTFNKVWIVPDEAVVYENAKMNAVFVVQSRLKVMLEQDYLAANKHKALEQYGMTEQGLENKINGTALSTMASHIIKQIVIPALEKEVNEGKNFAGLRQVYNSLILAAWYKKNLRDNVLVKGYVDRGKTAGVDTKDKKIDEKIYQQYLKAYRKGVYNYIKEEQDPVTNEIVPRKYFSGGIDARRMAVSLAMASPEQARKAAASLAMAASKHLLFGIVVAAAALTGGHALAAQPAPYQAPATIVSMEAASHMNWHSQPTTEAFVTISNTIEQNQLSVPISGTVNIPRLFVDTINAQGHGNHITEGRSVQIDSQTAGVMFIAHSGGIPPTPITSHDRIYNARPGDVFVIQMHQPGALQPPAAAPGSPAPQPPSASSTEVDNLANQVIRAYENLSQEAKARLGQDIRPYVLGLKAQFNLSPSPQAKVVAIGNFEKLQQAIRDVAGQSLPLPPAAPASAGAGANAFYGSNDVISFHWNQIQHDQKYQSQAFRQEEQRLYDQIMQARANQTALNNLIPQYQQLVNGARASAGVFTERLPNGRMAGLIPASTQPAPTAHPALQPAQPIPSVQPPAASGSPLPPASVATASIPSFLVRDSAGRLMVPQNMLDMLRETSAGRFFHPDGDKMLDQILALYHLNVDKNQIYQTQLTAGNDEVNATMSNVNSDYKAELVKRIKAAGGVLPSDLEGRSLEMIYGSGAFPTADGRPSFAPKYYLPWTASIDKTLLPAVARAPSSVAVPVNPVVSMEQPPQVKPLTPAEMARQRANIAFLNKWATQQTQRILHGGTHGRNDKAMYGGIDLEKVALSIKGSGGVRTAFSDPRILNILLNARGLLPRVESVKPVTVPMVGMLLGFNVPANDNVPADAPVKSADAKPLFRNVAFIDLRKIARA